MRITFDTPRYWDNTPRYWYFVTDQDMGDKMTLSPRTPYSKAWDEPDDKRICVAPTAAHCLAAVNLDGPNVYIYRTVRRVIATKPYGVADYLLTKEHWLLKKTTFQRVTNVDVSRVRWTGGDRGGSPESSWYPLQRRDKQNIIRWLGKKDKRLCTIALADTNWRVV